MLVGRKIEQEYLKNCLSSPEAELIAVIGRRRVGKTYLIRQVYQDKIDFEIVGIHNTSKEEQLAHFDYEISKTFNREWPTSSKSWIEAFRRLIEVIEDLDKHKPVLFMDELPWLESPRSGFMKGFEFFWNSWASKQKIVLVVSGSAASWMHRNLINNRGGMHNRVTRYISLKPFTLAETQEYLTSRGVHLNQYQISLLYMTLGGIPYYLKLVERGLSAVQIIHQLIFDPKSSLRHEFYNLYRALFDTADRHTEIIRLLAVRNSGFTTAEIVEKTNISSGGTLTKTLKELELSGFISLYLPLYAKKRGARYKLTDEYSLFYLKFIDKIEGGKSVDVNKLAQTPLWKSWAGYAFENLVWKHVEQLAEQLGISGIHYETSALINSTSEGEGFQVDLLIDRSDHTVNLCELKFYDYEFNLSLEEANKIRRRIQGVKEQLKKPKHVFVTVVSPYGMKSGKNTLGLVDQSYDLEILFN